MLKLFAKFMHIISTHIDSRIANDDITVVQFLDEITQPQINEFVTIAEEASAANVTAVQFPTLLNIESA